MKTLRRILSAILIVVVLFLATGFLLPSKVFLQDSITIRADAYLVYYQINNLKNWEDWCPFFQNSNHSLLKFGKIIEGQNAHCFWRCNAPETKDSGSLIITGNTKNSEIVLLADFFSFGNCNLIFSLKPLNDSVKINLSMNTNLGNNPLTRWLALFSDKMLRPDFLSLLNGLNTRIEQINQSNPYSVSIAQLPERQVLTISDTTIAQKANREMYRMYSLIAQCINNQLINKNGLPAASFNALKDTNSISISVQIPVKACLSNCQGIQCTKLPAQEVLMITHFESRKSIAKAYQAIYKALSDRGIYNKNPIWESYPEQTAPLPDSMQKSIILSYLIQNE